MSYVMRALLIRHWSRSGLQHPNQSAAGVSYSSLKPKMHDTKIPGFRFQNPWSSSPACLSTHWSASELWTWWPTYQKCWLLVYSTQCLCSAAELTFTRWFPSMLTKPHKQHAISFLLSRSAQGATCKLEKCKMYMPFITVLKSKFLVLWRK